MDGEGRRVCANRRFIGSGRPSIFSPIAPRRSSFPPTLYLSRRRAILSAFSLRNARSFCVSLRRARLRRWIDPSRCFPCARDKSSGAPTTIRHGAFLFTALDAATGEVIERSLSASSRTRVPELPARDRAPCPARTRSAPDHEQRRHPQDADDPKVARRATEIACPLHPTASSWVNPVERFLADITEKQIRRDVHHSTEELETAIDRGSRRQSKTLPLDQIRRQYPRQHQVLLAQTARNRRSPNRNRTKLRIRTLIWFAGDHEDTQVHRLTRPAYKG